MKGFVATKSGPMDIPMVFQKGEKITKPSLLCKVVTITISGVVLVTVVAIVVILGIRFGQQNTDGNIKEYHITFHSNNQVIVEDAFISNREEMYINDNVTAVFDHQTEFVVYKFKGWKDCFVATFNNPDEETLEQFKITHGGSELDLNVEMIRQNIQVTDIRIPIAALGPMSQGLCAGRDPYMLRTVDDDQTDIGREKRQTVHVGYSFHTCFLITWRQLGSRGDINRNYSTISVFLREMDEVIRLMATSYYGSNKSYDIKTLDDYLHLYYVKKSL